MTYCYILVENLFINHNRIQDVSSFSIFTIINDCPLYSINDYTIVTIIFDHIFVKSWLIDSIKPFISESFINDRFRILLIDKDNIKQWIHY